ncbi:diguanylate cyclase [Aminobacterium sp. MB27-C1]|jgi:dihydroorotate dehydrogenase subfamily 1|uniref:dihydroorotate dehydrogenase n=1 Tax=Aminobacterium sp. MB27-C1 TaxID=3070661 RepID=UPI001BCFA10A|nr:diguanylate cyclase [Aminobacterium sp. MB27-C1]MDD2207461.1 diguanylate cyclase [Aminobacterium sp.]MDD3708419.1 diguanylate cyclase [Aminobacterium sp.]MDD4229198.1 diguanylate cyclase [Aminobacterium sp.]MDD4552217.1 diguanylate cyclase [Aminobacterium sp.]WMI72559.1 diguanylate cyclase [Aminobacterium sp. MB27-C1]
MVGLARTICGVTFKSPVLTAAGPNVATKDHVLAAISGGAGGIVTKTISVSPAQDPRPTIRKGPLGSLINCETWSEKPVEDSLPIFNAIKEKGLPLIVSIGYKPQEVTFLGKLLERDVHPDIIEFSTHYVGHEISPLIDVAKSLRDVVSVPIWMKISPNILDVQNLAKAASPFVDGFVAINSLGPVLDFDVEKPSPLLGSTFGQGWMSGPPILPIALRIVYETSISQPKPVIGVGGIEKGEDAIKFFMAGASLVQICSGALKKGSAIYGTVSQEIEEWLEKHGYSSIDDVQNKYIDAVKHLRH